MASIQDLNTARVLLLESAINLIKEHLEVYDVFDLDMLAIKINKKYLPDDIFTKRQLEGWALENGFIKKDINNG